MSKIHTSKPSASAVGFRGIRSQPPKDGELTATDINNFRIRPDGSLEKRMGFAPLLTTNQSVRAFIQTRINGIPFIYLLYGNKIYLCNLQTFQISTQGTVSSQTGNAQFFYHRETLYLLAGTTLYTLSGGNAIASMGYVPLIGKDWGTSVPGDPYEPVNLLHNQVRISYIINSPPTIFLACPYPILAIHSVTVNGITVPSTRYELDTHFNTVNILEPNEGDRVVVHISIADGCDVERESLLATNQSLAFGSAEKGRLCVWSNQHNLMFRSAYVTDESFAESKAFAPQSTSIYFPTGSQFYIGDGRYSIRGVTRERDQLLVFTEGNTWMVSNISSNTVSLSTSGIHATIGCSSHTGVDLAKNHTVSVGDRTIYQWQEDTASMYRAESISEEIDPLLSDSFYTRANLCYFSAKDELWVNDPETDEVWIRRMETGDWFRYSGIPTRRLLELNGRMGFLGDNGLFIFREDLTTDLDADRTEHPIFAVYKADLGDMGNERRKTLSHLLLRGESDGNSLSVHIRENEQKAPISVPIHTEADGSFLIRAIRLPSRRLRRATLTLEAAGKGRPVLHRLSIHTK